MVGFSEGVREIAKCFIHTTFKSLTKLRTTRREYGMALSIESREREREREHDLPFQHIPSSGKLDPFRAKIIIL